MATPYLWARRSIGHSCRLCWAGVSSQWPDLQVFRTIAPMRRQARRASAALLLGFTLLATSSLPAVASGGRGQTAAPAPSGWVVDRARFEPVPEPGHDPVPLSVEGLGSYRGAIQIAPSGAGVAVINQLGLDEYLRGLSEVPATWPPEALQAQAIP